MSTWIWIALAGGLVSLVGLGILYLQYRRGELKRSDFLLFLILYAVILGAAILVLEQTGALLVIIWIPAWFAVVHKTRRARELRKLELD